MKKITLLFLLVGTFAFAQFPAPYCGPITFEFAVEPITLVNFAGINNASSNVVAGATAHEDFTSISGAVTASQSYTITLKGNTDGNWTNRFMVFVDWNQDGDFGDADEAYTIVQTITNSTGLDATQVTQSLSVPVTALGGITRMRVKKIFGEVNYTNPCLGTGYGQVEDYSLVVTPSSDCTGAPAPGDTVSSETSVCAGISFGLSLQNDVAAAGITYQWQVSTNGVDYVNIDGATNSTHTASQTVASYYQCVVTCGVSTISTTSTPVMVGLNPGNQCYCTPIYTEGTNDGDLISNIIIQGTTLSNNTGTATDGPSYSYFTGQPNYTAELQAGNSYTVEVTVGTFGGQNIAVWIDYNDNGLFEANERVGFTTTSIPANGTATFTITLACNPPLGTHRMRVRDVWNTTGSNINPCSSYGYGETEDYDVTITSAVSCPQPSNLGATDITSSSAILVWATGCAETLWDVHVTEAGGGAPTGEPSNPDSVSPLEIDSLLPDTAYEFYVRANCEGDGFSLWSGPFAFTTLSIAPDCATVIYPADGAVDVPVGTVAFSWEPATTGGAATSYEMYYGLTPDTVTNLVGNFTDTTVDIDLTGFSTTFYWMIVPINSGGEAMGCAIWSFTTMEAPGYCLSGELYPQGVYTPEVCDGVTENVIVNNAWAGEYSVVNVIAGESYTFISSVPTDLITISSDGGSTAAAYGITPVTWVADVTGEINFYIHTDIECGTQDTARVRSVVCGEVSADAPDWANLQFPYDATIEVGGTVVVYGQVYASGLTDVEPNIQGQAPGIQAWVGVSPAGQNTNPDTWTTWIPATWNSGHVSNNDEYQAEIGAGLAAGTYYYATRFRLNDGGFVYGGTNNGFWDGTTYLSGVLTVTPPPAPDNDTCANATPLTPGAVFEDNVITATNTNATVNAADPVPTCGNFNFATNAKDVWFSVVVPDSGTLTVETQLNGGLDDTALAVYSGSCESLTQINCNDDIALGVLNSRLQLTDLTAGETLLVRVWGYNGAQGSFTVSAYDASLSTGSFDNVGFKYYPNPVKDVLNLNYTSTITNVSVVNLLGQQVLAKNINANESQLDLSSLSAGTYLVKVTTEENFEKTIKIVKQ